MTTAKPLGIVRSIWLQKPHGVARLAARRLRRALLMLAGVMAV